MKTKKCFLIFHVIFTVIVFQRQLQISNNKLSLFSVGDWHKKNHKRFDIQIFVIT